MNNIENILKESGICVTTTKGDSMQPLLVEGRDKVVIVPPQFPLKRYDIPVYRRYDHYTMHRIIKISKKGYVICGDNRGRIERDITDKDIVGVLEGVYQGDKYISRDSEEYLYYARKACRALPLKVVKHFLFRVKNKIKRIKKVKETLNRSSKNGQ